MRAYLQATIDSVLALPAETIIGSIFIAFALALPVAGAHAWSRRVGKAAATMLLALTMAVNLVGMTIVSGHAWLSMKGFPGVGAPRMPDREQVQDRHPKLLHEDLARLLLAEADADGDGCMSPEEAAAAAIRFVKFYAPALRGPLGAVNLSSGIKAYFHKARVTRHVPSANLRKAVSEAPSGNSDVVADMGEKPIP